MDIVIVSNFCYDISATDFDRFQQIASTLVKKHNVELITSSFNHERKKHRQPCCAEAPYAVTYLYEPGYPKNICLRRFWSHFVWGENVKKYLRQREKPDVVYCAVPSLTGPLQAARYCERNRVRFIIDVQDLWPEAFQMVFHVPVLSGIAFAPFRAAADAIYRRADAIAAVSRTYAERAVKANRKRKTCHSVYLGTDLRRFDENVRENRAARVGDAIWLGYCGTLGASYDLLTVFRALEKLRDGNLGTPRLIIMGDGPRKAEFERYAQEKKLDVAFTGRLPYSKMCGVLAACDIAVNPIRKGAAQSIINKHADYAAAGIPVLNTQESPEYRALVDEYKMGFNSAAGDAAQLAENLSALMRDAALRKEMGRNARRCAEERFDRGKTYAELTGLIEGMGEDRAL